MPCTPGVSAMVPARVSLSVSMTCTSVPWAMKSRWPPSSKVRSSQPPSPGRLTSWAMRYCGAACTCVLRAVRASAAASRAHRAARGVSGFIEQLSGSVNQPCAQIEQRCGQESQGQHRCGVDTECKAYPRFARRRRLLPGGLIEVHQLVHGHAVVTAHTPQGGGEHHQPQVMALPQRLED